MLRFSVLNSDNLQWNAFKNLKARRSSEDNLNSIAVHKFTNHISQLVRYGFVGLAALCFDYLILVVLTEYCHINHLLSATAGFFVGLLVNYSLATNFVFKESKLTSKRLEFVIFSVIGIGGLFFTIGLMWLLTDFFSVHYTISKAVAVGAVFLWNFYARKLILFQD
jgi:putative flippase GtrA